MTTQIGESSHPAQHDFGAVATVVRPRDIADGRGIDQYQLEVSFEQKCSLTSRSISKDFMSRIITTSIGCGYLRKD